MTKEEKKQLSDILDELGGTLDITETQFNTAVRSYQAVGEQLVKENSQLIPYNPEILPQGSFMLGTMVKPINEEDDIDIDLVCQLTNKAIGWTQFDLKQKVGDQIKENKTYSNMVKKPEGRRCWTLKYADDSFHLDILPAIVDKNYKIVLEKAFSNTEMNEIDNLAIRITDSNLLNYTTSTNHLEWLKSNPFGYAKWFFNVASFDLNKGIILNEAINPVRTYSKEKLPLQRVVQILKRHRDIMFNGDENKPISIIITTLATMAYKKQTSIIDALIHIINEMPNMIEERYMPRLDKTIKWIPNPVNKAENFADKWLEVKEKEENFYKWHKQLKTDIYNIINNIGKGQHVVQGAMSKPFGPTTVIKAFNNYGLKRTENRDRGLVRMATSTGTLGQIGQTVKKHNFEGEIEE